MIRVLLADDQALVRDGLRYILEQAPDIEVVAEADNGVRVLAAVASDRPDVVLMDIRMPVMDGLTACRRLMAEPAPPKVIVLTTFDTDEYIVEALRAGASGFLLKDVRAPQLIDAIHVAAAGEALLGSSVTRRVIAWSLQGQAAVGARQRLRPLTDREREVLTMIGRGLSNQEIAQALFLSEATVKTHINRVLAKLNLRNRAAAVIAAYETGLVRPGT